MNPSSSRPQVDLASIGELEPLFPGYQFVGPLAPGRVGTAYRAHQTALDRPVVIKILPRQFGDDESFRNSFQAEAIATAQLKHPNLIGVYDFGAVDGMLFTVMEFVDGNSLQDAVEGNTVEPAQAVELVSAICHGLTHAHNRGVLHGGINPANILLDAKLQPKIGNFGIARRLGRQAGDRRESTSRYAAPELSRGGPVDQRADVYSVGVLLHRLLTGQEPEQFPLPAASALCGCTRLLETIIDRATKADPDARFESTDELGKSLAQARKSIPRRPQPPPRNTSQAVPVGRPALVKRKSHAGVVGLVILIGLGVGAAAIFSKRGRDSGTGTQDAPLPVIHAATPSTVKLSSAAPTQLGARPETAKEPVEKGLARLKGKLAAGERLEFPDGTVARDGSHYLVVDQTMAWKEAEEFAEAHGAHLAVLASGSDRDWFRAQFKIERPLWLGAGKGAQESWQWIDGAPWNSDDALPESFETHRRMAFSAAGGLFPARAAQAYGLALQWRADGSNPGTVAAQLERTAASMSTGDHGQLLYPLGTRTREDSHYYVLSKDGTWDEARQLAESLGAKLAVPSTVEEDEWITSVLVSSLRPEQGLWLGGFQPKPGDRWQWITGEAWNNSGWQVFQPGADPTLNRLALRGGNDEVRPGWVAGNGTNGVASGMILEWGPPRAPVAVTSFELKPWLEGVNRKIATRVGSDLDGFAKERKELVQDYSRAMNRILRKEEKEPVWGGMGRGRGGPGGFRWPGDNTKVLEEIKEGLKESTKNDQLLSALPQGASKDFSEQQDASEAALKILEETYDLKLRGQIELYAEGVRKKGEELFRKGYLDAVRELNELANSLEGNPAAFLSVLFPGSPRAVLPWPPTVAENEAEEEEQRELPGFPRMRRD